MRHWLLFSPYRYGHHVDSIRYQLAQLAAHGFASRVTYLVEPTFLEQHPDVVAMAAQSSGRGCHVEFLAAHPDEVAELDQGALANVEFSPLMRGQIDPASRTALEWKLFCRYAEQVQASAGCFLFGDHVFAAVIAGLRAPCRFSMLYYHFWLVQDLYPLDGALAPTPELQRKLRQGEMLLKRALVHPQLMRVLTHDFVVVEQLDRLAPGKLRFIPERAPQLQPANQVTSPLRQELHLDPTRMVFLIFGDLTARKGIYEVLAALEQLADTDAAKLTLLLIGRTPYHLLAGLEAALETARRRTQAQIVMQQGFVAEDALLTYFVLADVILAVYPQHVGSSGVLVNAAVAQRPVLSTDFGLMAQMTRRYGLGLTVDASSPQAIASSLHRFLQEPHTTLFDPENGKRLAQASTPQAYAAAFLGELVAGEPIPGEPLTVEADECS